MNFSVVIPLYNKEETILNAVKSVLNQTFEDFEIIVVDDGSTDNGLEIIENIKDRRMKVFKQNNKGVSSARNMGIKNASYDYIALLDADDMWKPDFLEIITELIFNYPEAGAYGTSYEILNADGTIGSRGNKNKYNGEINFFKKSLESPILSSSSTVIPKKVFSEIGTFSPNITRGEDQDMWIRVALNYKVIATDKVCAIYNNKLKNRTSDKPIEYSKSLMSYVEELLITEKQKGNKSAEFEEMIINRILNKVRFLIEENRSGEARKILWKYKYTKKNKKKWFKNYLLTFKPVYMIYKILK